MPKKIEQLNKRYYTIGEVASMFEVSTSLIRFWENEFEILKPHKNSKGDRRFTPENVMQFQQIYHLVKEREFTLNGAKKEIDHLLKLERENQKIIKHLKQIRSGLEKIKAQL